MYCRIRNHIVSICLEVTYLEETCATRLAALTEEQVDEVQEIVDETLGNCGLDERQIPQALDFLRRKPAFCVLYSSSTKSPHDKTPR